MAVEVRSDGRARIAGLTPGLQPGRYGCATLPQGGPATPLMAQASGRFREPEGLSLIVPEAAGGRGARGMRRMPLHVCSSVDGVGLTTAVAGRLAEHGTACNRAAAYHHDHVFGPASRAEAAGALLGDLQTAAG